MKSIATSASRRKFLMMAGWLGVGIGSTACNYQRQNLEAARAHSPNTSQSHTTATQAVASSHNMETPAVAPMQQEHDMDAMHEAGVKTFVNNVGKNPAFWKNALSYKQDGEVKVFEVTTKDIEWEVVNGSKVNAMAYNSHVPGPEIRVTEGDKVRVILKNEMNESTAIHFHGCLLPNNMDGVPYITQPPVKPGQTFTYEFTAKNPGSHMYHSHHNSTKQVTSGLLGAFIIEPKDKSKEPQYDSDYTLILNDSSLGFTINGKGFPDTQPIVAKKGERVRIRYMNEGLMIHPMHLHGLEQWVFAKDGWNLPNPFTCDTLNIAPGERYDVIVTCHTEGVWAFHCHILSHAESETGMYGMVTAVIVQ